MEPIFRFFASRHLLALVVTVMILLVGASSLMFIQRDVYPHVEFGEAMVTTRYPGASPEDVELNVTNKIEEQLKEVSGIDRMTSYSMENISVLDIMVDPNSTDTDEVIREIREAVARVTDFPVEVDESPLVTEITTTTIPVVEVGLIGDLPYDELRSYAKLFKKKLENVSGVASIDEFGLRDREVKVEVDHDAIDRYQIPLRMIIQAIASRNIRSTGGSFESYTSEKNVVTLAQFDSPFEVGDVIVRSSFDGPAIRVKDLAIIKDDFEEEKVFSRMNGKAAISFLVFKKETADAIRTIDGIRAMVAEEKEFMPAGIEVSYSDDFSRYIRNRMKVVASNGVIGLVLVIVLLGLFLNVGSAFWVALGIPVTLLGTIALLPAFDQYLDVIGLAGLIMVVGIVVDDAIIIAENIFKKREEGLPPLEAATKGIAEVYKPVVTTILTTFAAFAPMFFMSGMMGKFVFVIPLVITLALFVSLIEGTVALPAHLISGLGGRTKTTKGKRQWFMPVRNAYRWFIKYILRVRYLVVATSFAMLFGGIWYAVNKMDFVLFPSSVADEFFIRVELPIGASLKATSDKVREVEALLDQLPEGEVDSYVTRVGTQGEFIMGENENWAVIEVYLSPYSTRNRIADEIVSSLREKTDRFEGYENLLYYVDAGGPPVGRPITLRIVGTDDDQRSEFADSVVALLGTIDGVKDVDRNDKRGKDQVELDIDFAQLSRLGLTVADIARTVRIAYDGELVTSVRYGDEDVAFRVTMNEAARSDAAYLSNLLIPNNRDRLIPLKSVASLRTSPGSSAFYHFDGDRAVMITADVEQGVITPIETTERVKAHFNLATDWRGLQLVVGGEAEETADSMRSLISAFITALVAIYFLLVLLFNSTVQPLLVMSAIPLGIVGVVIAFALHGQPLGFMAMMGLIGLSGVVVNDSLVLVSHTNRLKAERADDSLIDIIADGAADRLRAVTLTTLTTVAGLLPLAYGLGGADPFIAPMALAMGFGLMFSSPITLALVPSLYMIMEDFKRMFGKMGRRVAGVPKQPHPADSAASAESQGSR